jgi:hypothetical protein
VQINNINDRALVYAQRYSTVKMLYPVHTKHQICWLPDREILALYRECAKVIVLLYNSHVPRQPPPGRSQHIRSEGLFFSGRHQE